MHVVKHTKMQAFEDSKFKNLLPFPCAHLVSLYSFSFPFVFLCVGAVCGLSCVGHQGTVRPPTTLQVTKTQTYIEDTYIHYILTQYIQRDDTFSQHNSIDEYIESMAFVLSCKCRHLWICTYVCIQAYSLYH